jgi:hypothetical protein
VANAEPEPEPAPRAPTAQKEKEKEKEKEKARNPSPVTNKITPRPRAAVTLRELCVDTRFLTYISCMNRACAQPDNANAPQCVQLRQRKNERHPMRIDPPL